MKQLIIYSHLNPKSFTKAIAEKVEENAKIKGDEIKVIDLYSDGFNPVLGMPDVAHQFMGQVIPEDIKKYQEMVSWADHITVVYPMWWAQMPAILKGFIDRVFSYGFAFSISPNGVEQLLKGKTAHVYINTNTPSEIYEQTKMHEAQNRVINEGIFGFCGIKTEVTFFGSVVNGTDELRKGYLETIN